MGTKPTNFHSIRYSLVKHMSCLHLSKHETGLQKSQQLGKSVDMDSALTR